MRDVHASPTMRKEFSIGPPTERRSSATSAQEAPFAKVMSLKEVYGRHRTPPVAMDILVSNAYLFGMILRFITMLSILAITVMTTVSSAHAARMNMGSGPDHAAHAVEMMSSPGIAERECDAGQHCGSANAEMCEFVCAGLSAFLTSPSGEYGHTPVAASHDVPSEAIHISCAPGLNERPPKLRLL